MSAQFHAQQILFFCQRLNDKGYLAAADGNLSVRLNDASILITPSGRNKSLLQEHEMARITLEGKSLHGKSSSETAMHLDIYRHVAEARAVVHAHPPSAIAWSIAKPDWQELPSECISELILSVGTVPIVPYARPGTEAMGKALLPFLPHSRVMILGRHGALSWGETLEEAYNGIERLEHTALVLKTAYDLGGLTPLPAAEVAVLRDMRQKLGAKTL